MTYNFWYIQPKLAIYVQNVSQRWHCIFQASAGIQPRMYQVTTGLRPPKYLVCAGCIRLLEYATPVMAYISDK
jgi:hypothetical protein